MLESHDNEVLQRAAASVVPKNEPLSTQHAHQKCHVPRPEHFRRYDPISSSLAFTKADGGEQTILVGNNGRLRAVLESGVVESREARDIGLPPPETYRGKAKQTPNPGHFNPLTHEYHIDSSPRDSARNSGKKTVTMKAGSLTPRLNPLTQRLDPINCELHALPLRVARSYRSPTHCRTWIRTALYFCRPHNIGRAA